MRIKQDVLNEIMKVEKELDVARRLEKKYSDKLEKLFEELLNFYEG